MQNLDSSTGSDILHQFLCQTQPNKQFSKVRKCLVNLYCQLSKAFPLHFSLLFSSSFPKDFSID